MSQMKTVDMTGYCPDLIELPASATGCGGYFRDAIWQHSIDAAFVSDAATGQIVEVNPAACKLSGYERAALIGKHQSHLHPLQERARVAAAFEKSGQGPALFTGFHLRDANGEEIPVEISSTREMEVQGTLYSLTIVRDIRRTFADQQSLLAQNWALRAYSAAAERLTGELTPEAMMQSVCEAIVDQETFPLAAIGVAERGPGLPVRFLAAAGRARSYLDGVNISWAAERPEGNGPTGRAIRSGAVQVLLDAQANAKFAPWRQAAHSHGIRSSISIPLHWGPDTKGALLVYAEQPTAFDPAALEVFGRLARQLVFALNAAAQNVRLEQEGRQREDLQKQVLQALEATIGALGAAMEHRDPYTGGHERRVAAIACGIAEELGLAPDVITGVRMGAFVHDIGKIGIPMEILGKPKRLSALEFELVKQHVSIGYGILKDIPFPWPVAQIVYQHHEKIDGSGYPRGLKGDETLLEAKIVSVADIVESIASHRPYRGALGLRKALDVIQEDAGKTLDPVVVAACLALFQRDHQLASLYQA